MKHFATAMLGLGIMVAALPTARAADTTCPPSPSPGSTVNGNLIVQSGTTTCTLNDVTVTGNVQVQKNATLSINGEPSTIEGNVNVQRGASLQISNHSTTLTSSTIGGNIEANQCSVVLITTGGSVQSITVGGNVLVQNCGSGNMVSAEIAGNLSCKNSGDCDVEGNGPINGNVQIDNNTTATVYNNTIGNNLQCQGNTSISGGSNTVGGHKQGQCANF